MSYQETTTLDKFKATDSTKASARWTKVQYIPYPGAVTTNKIGIRVYVISLGRGAYPPSLITTRQTSSVYPQCYIPGYKEKNCLAMAHLSDPGTTYTSRYLQYTEPRTVGSTSHLGKGCRVILMNHHCITPEPGYIVNLDVHVQIPLQYNLYEIAKYDAYDQTIRDHYVEFTSNTAKRYLVSCPISCKFWINC